MIVLACVGQALSSCSREAHSHAGWDPGHLVPLTQTQAWGKAQFKATSLPARRTPHWRSNWSWSSAGSLEGERSAQDDTLAHDHWDAQVISLTCDRQWSCPGTGAVGPGEKHRGIGAKDTQTPGCLGSHEESRTARGEQSQQNGSPIPRSQRDAALVNLGS